MKRNILLLIGLMGLIALEYGCKEDPIVATDSNEMRVTGIDNIEYLVIDSTGLLVALFDDEATYEDIRYRVGLSWELIAGASYTNYSAYAESRPHTFWKPDSIHILDNGVDVSDLFSVGSFNNIAEYISDPGSQTSNYVFFRFLKAPDVVEEKTYVFRFFSASNEYEIISRGITITP